MSIFFTADHHFGHENIIRFCDRPYGDVEEMDRDLVARWNSVVGPKDTIYHLGDLSYYSPQRTVEIVQSLHGKIIFIWGNHDNKGVRRALRASGHMDHEYLVLKHEKKSITMCHYPMVTWKGRRSGAIMLHGHSHGRNRYPQKGMLDVGVDCHNYAPVEFSEVVRLCSLNL